MTPLLLTLSFWALATPPETPSLADSTWRVTTSHGRELILKFLKNGVLEYTSPAGNFQNATWSQQGDKVTFEMNKKYAEWTGTLKGDEIEGTGTNINGDQWTWKAKRLLAAPAAERASKPMTPKLAPASQTSAVPPAATAPTATRSATSETSRAESVAGTVWEGVDSDGDPFTYRFLPDGVLEYKADKTTGHGTWKQNGSQVTMETNNRFAEFTITITGNTMTGKASNVDGRTWTFTARKVAGPESSSALRTSATPPSAKPTAPSSAEVTAVDLVGTSWRGVDSDGDEYTLHFHADGRLEAETPRGPQRRATWSLSGNEIYFEFNNRYSEYRGTIKGDVMSGRAENTQGRRWTWNFRKIGGPAPRSETPAAPRLDLVGTTWKGRDSDGDEYTLVFKENGELQVTSTSGEIRQATWKLEGNRLRMEMNGGYSKYQGTIQGDVMEGQAENVKGRTWTWKFRRQPAAPPKPAVP